MCEYQLYRLKNTAQIHRRRYRLGSYGHGPFGTSAERYDYPEPSDRELSVQDFPGIFRHRDNMQGQ